MKKHTIMRKTFALMVLASVIMLTNCTRNNSAEDYAKFEVNEEIATIYDFINEMSNAGKIIVVQAIGVNDYEISAVDGMGNDMPLIKIRSESVDDSWTYYGEIGMTVIAFNKAWKAIEKIYGSASFKVRIEPVEGSNKRKIYHKAA